MPDPTPAPPEARRYTPEEITSLSSLTSDPATIGAVLRQAAADARAQETLREFRAWLVSESQRYRDMPPTDPERQHYYGTNRVLAKIDELEARR